MRSNSMQSYRFVVFTFDLFMLLLDFLFGRILVTKMDDNNSYEEPPVKQVFLVFSMCKRIHRSHQLPLVVRVIVRVIQKSYRFSLRNSNAIAAVRYSALCSI